MTALRLPPLAAVLLRPRREALAAFQSLGWRPWSDPVSLDAERRRLLNLDLSEPDLGFTAGDSVEAVARVETDLAGLVVLVELVASEPARPAQVAAQLLPGAPGEPRTSGGAAAREWIWGPESGSEVTVGEEPVRLWICAEQAYGDRLWLIASVVRRASDPDEDPE
jgi:hypothetical protein